MIQTGVHTSSGSKTSGISSVEDRKESKRENWSESLFLVSCENLELFMPAGFAPRMGSALESGDWISGRSCVIT